MKSLLFGVLLVVASSAYTLRDIPTVLENDQGLLCDVCEFVGDEVNKRILTKETREQVVKVAGLVCDKLPIFGKECKSTVEEYGDDLVDKLFKLFNVETICAKAHLCQTKNDIPAFFGVSDSEGCKACMDGLTIVKIIIDSDQFEDLLDITVTEICMAAGGDVKTCTAISTTIVNQIAENLRPMFVPAALCQSAGACPATDLLADAKVSGSGCIVCKDSFQIIKNLLTSAEVSEILDVAIDETCIAMGFGVETCEKLAGTIFHEILDNLMASFDPDFICGHLGSCPQKPCPFLASLGADSEGCKACVDALGIVQQILEAPATIDLVHIAVDETCVAIGGDAKTCEAIVDGIIDPIITNLITLFKPRSLCAQAGACPASLLSVPNKMGCVACEDTFSIIKKVLESDELAELVHLGINKTCGAIGGAAGRQCIMILSVVVDNSRLQLLPLFNPHAVCAQTGACPAHLEESNLQGGIFCDFCKDSVLELKNIAADQATDAMLDEITAIICNTVKIPFCKTVIGSVVQQELTSILALDANSTCTNVGACTPDFTVETVAVETVAVETVAVETVGDTCSECESIANEIVALLKNEEVDSLIKEAITEICTVLPIANCEATIDGYFDQIVALIKNMTGKDICGLIGLCGSKAPVVAPVVPALALGDTCSECAMIAGLLLTELKDPTVQAQVEAAIDQACVVLPISNCKDTIHQYMVIAESFIGTLDGKTVCGYVGLCSFGDAMEWF